jgi:hypothetical protein
MKALLAEIGKILTSMAKTPSKDVADAEPGQGSVTVISKHPSFGTQI